MFLSRPVLLTFLQRLGGSALPGELFLVDQTIQVSEGWQLRADDVALHAEIQTARRAEFDSLVRRLEEELALRVRYEFPGDYIPLPAGHAQRARPIPHIESSAAGGLQLRYFDP